MSVVMAYNGYADLDGVQVPITSASFAANQDIWHVSNVPQGRERIHIMPNKFEPGGNVSFYMYNGESLPLDLGNEECDEEAKEFGDVTVWYNCKNGVKVTFCRVSSLGVSCSAGDLMQFSLDFVGNKAEEEAWSEANAPTNTIMTWLDANIGDASKSYSSFDLSVDFGVEGVYAIGASAGIAADICKLTPDFYMPGVISGTFRKVRMEDGMSKEIDCTIPTTIPDTVSESLDFSAFTVQLDGIYQTTTGSIGTGVTSITETMFITGATAA